MNRTDTLAVALVVVLAYVLSAGPACWLVKKNASPDWALEVYARVYAPFCRWPCPEPLRGMLRWYISLRC
jgi:hypothetical protein